MWLVCDVMNQLPAGGAPEASVHSLKEAAVVYWGSFLSST